MDAMTAACGANGTTNTNPGTSTTATTTTTTATTTTATSTTTAAAATTTGAPTPGQAAQSTPPAGPTVALPFTGLDRPVGVAVDGQGAVYVTDSGNNRVLKLAAYS